jgi:hypothetical protein
LRANPRPGQRSSRGLIDAGESDGHFVVGAVVVADAFFGDPEGGDRDGFNVAQIGHQRQVLEGGD